MSMRACFASLNTKGFSSSIKSNSYNLPDETHLTYDGCFNELKYSIGPKAKKAMQLHLGYARAQYQNSLFDSQINDYLTVFTKGSKDGEDRDQRILNSVIILDISGSMGWALNSKGEGNRMELAKQAILMFYSKLRPNDSFGLTVFNNSAETILPVELVGKRTFQEVANIVRNIKVGGGTTMMTGFIEANKALMSYLQKIQYVKDNSAENRIIMLTDVEDNSISQAKKFVQEVQNSHIHTTIIGISDQFRSDVCESLNQVKGFNYFCATEVDDLKKYLFENFSFTFFPDLFDIQIGVENTNIEFIEVFGTVDSAKVALYNKESVNKFVITKSKTSFPSELEISEQGEVFTYGGLILVKLHLKDKNKSKFQGKVTVSYKTGYGQKISDEYSISYDSPENQQYYSDESLYEALSGFFYVSEVKNILKKAKDQPKQARKNYIQPLQNLKNLAPKAKLEELEDLLRKLKSHLAEQQKNQAKQLF